jgi:hypothetical protein
LAQGGGGVIFVGYGAGGFLVLFELVEDVCSKKRFAFSEPHAILFVKRQTTPCYGFNTLPIASVVSVPITFRGSEFVRVLASMLR